MHTVEFLPHEETIPSDLLCLGEFGGEMSRDHVVHWLTTVQEAMEFGDWPDALDAAMRLTACLARLSLQTEDSLYFCRRKT